MRNPIRSRSSIQLHGRARHSGSGAGYSPQKLPETEVLTRRPAGWARRVVNRVGQLIVLAAASTVVLLQGCSDSDTLQITPPEPPPEPTLSVEISRTEFGIPHIKADDWESLGYGFGLAYAEDNYCVAMREIVFSIGRSAELLGEEEGSVESDLLFTFLNGDRAEFEADFVSVLPDFALELAEGFVEGMNSYLRNTGAENLAEGDLGCRNADWVFEFDRVDYFYYLRREALRGSSDQGLFRRALLDVTGPGVVPSSPGGSTDLESAASALQDAAAALRYLSRGSNALALGADMTQTGTGMLLGNPHQPWFGAGAWYMAHLTIPGVYDVAGAALQGFPFIGIGFNRDVAWTHTVSFANRFSLYELTLNPNNPLQYNFEGEWIDIDSQEVTIDVTLADGSSEQRTATFYTTQYGPIVNLRGISPAFDGWPMFTGTLLAFRDANLDTGIRGIQQWITKGQSTNLEEYVAALADIGNPVFHEIAADRNGDAFYGEISAIPFITQAQIASCVRLPVSQLLAASTSNVILSLDGSDADCAWGDDPDAPPGSNLYSSTNLPQFLTRDYAGNSNNSYWLSDANNPLEGFPSVMGPVGGEGQQQFLRTRIGHLMVEQRRVADDGLDDAPLFTLDTLKDFMYENRVYGAEIALDDVLQVCDGEPSTGEPPLDELMDACNALRAWDRRVNVDSMGAQVFTEFWQAIRAELGNAFQNVVDSDEFWRVDYDPADPLNTPSGIDLSLEVNRQRVVNALSAARDRLVANNVPLEAAWGDIQFLERGDERVPIHGGAGTMGVYGAIGASLRDGGYVNPSNGNSYIQAVTFDESECPIADVILVPSQSTDPASPHFADLTRLYSEKGWVRFPFCEEDIEAQRISGPTVIEVFEFEFE